MPDVFHHLPLTPDDEMTDEVDRTLPQYRAVERLAVLSLLLGLLTAFTALTWWATPLPIAGLATGYLALRKIRANRSELSGEALARLGMTLSVAIWIAGLARLSYVYRHDAPDGYRAVSFHDLQPARDAAADPFPPLAQQLEGQRVFVKGYMMPGRFPTGIRQFVLASDAGYCKFCTKPPGPTELIYVMLEGDLRIDHTERLVGIGGVFHLVLKPEERMKIQRLIYRIDADVVR